MNLHEDHYDHSPFDLVSGRVDRQEILMKDTDPRVPRKAPPAEVVAAAQQREAERSERPQKPEWVDRFV